MIPAVEIAKFAPTDVRRQIRPAEEPRLLGATRSSRRRCTRLPAAGFPSRQEGHSSTFGYRHRRAINMTTIESTYVHVRRCACGASVEYTSATTDAARKFGAAHLDCDGEAIITSDRFRTAEMTAYRGSDVVASAYQSIVHDDWHVVTSDGTAGTTADTTVADQAQAEAILRMLLAAHTRGIRHGRWMAQRATR